MKQFILDLEELLGRGDSMKDTNDQAEIFLWDDESLENLLCGVESSGPRPANLFLPTLRCVEEIFQIYRLGDISMTLSMISALGFKRPLLSLGIARKLEQVMRGIIPQYPLPVIRFDLWALSPLVETIWEFAVEMNEKSLFKEIGNSLYRWFEHLHQYEAARRILQIMIAETEKDGSNFDKAFLINNFAYEYLLEERYLEAAPLFEKAANLFDEAGIRFETANARANYWLCRTADREDFKLAVLEEELPEIEKILVNKEDWRGRKPFILRARIAEERGDLPGAIFMVQQAIKLGERSNTQYPELDRQYLDQLEGKMRKGEKSQRT